MPRRHLLLLLTGEVGEQVQELRQEWDPVMAARIPPHVTLVYPQEVTDEELLIDRIGQATSEAGPFAMAPGEVEESNLGGVWLRVVDRSDTWGRLRETVLTPPFAPYPVTPHITIVHPRTSQRGPEALAAIVGTQIGGLCLFDEVLYTETSRDGMEILRRFPLAG